MSGTGAGSKAPHPMAATNIAVVVEGASVENSNTMATAVAPPASLIKTGFSNNSVGAARPAVASVTTNRRSGGIRKPRRIMFRRSQSEDEDDDNNSSSALNYSSHNNTSAYLDEKSTPAGEQSFSKHDGVSSGMHARVLDNSDMRRQHSTPVSLSDAPLDSDILANKTPYAISTPTDAKPFSITPITLAPGDSVDTAKCDESNRFASGALSLSEVTAAAASEGNSSGAIAIRDDKVNKNSSTTDSSSFKSLFSISSNNSSNSNKRVQFISGSSPEELVFPFWLPEYDDELEFTSIAVPLPPPVRPSSSLSAKRSLSAVALPDITSGNNSAASDGLFSQSQQNNNQQQFLSTNGATVSSALHNSESVNGEEKYAESATGITDCVVAGHNVSSDVLPSEIIEADATRSNSQQFLATSLPSSTGIMTISSTPLPDNSNMAPLHHHRQEFVTPNEILLLNGDVGVRSIDNIAGQLSVLNRPLSVTESFMLKTTGLIAANNYNNNSAVLLSNSDQLLPLRELEVDKIADEDIKAVEDQEEKTIDQSPDGRFVKLDIEIGRGSFKTVYKGMDTESGASVAWCQIPARNLSKTERKRFREEANMLKELRHPNIVRFCDYWEKTSDRGKCFILITELMTSGTLRTFMRRFQKLPQKVMKSWCRQILKGLNYLHSADPPVIHRDLKCDNILISGTSGAVKIGDLGLATFKSKSAAKSVIGTPEFMAPEMFEEHYDEKVDIYAYGMCMLEMATNEYPYSECQSAAQIYRKCISGLQPACLDKVEDPELRKIIERCIAKDVKERLSIRDIMSLEFFVEETNVKIELVHKEDDALGGKDVVRLRLKIPDATRVPGAILPVKPVAGGAAATAAAVAAGAVEAFEFDYNIVSDSSEDVARSLVDAGRVAEEDVKTVAKQMRDRCSEMLKERELLMKKMEKDKELHDRQQQYKDNAAELSPALTPTNISAPSGLPSVDASSATAPPLVTKNDASPAVVKQALAAINTSNLPTVHSAAVGGEAAPQSAPVQMAPQRPSFVPAETHATSEPPAASLASTVSLSKPTSTAASVHASGTATPNSPKTSVNNNNVAPSVMQHRKDLDNLDELRIKLHALSSGASVPAPMLIKVRPEMFEDGVLAPMKSHQSTPPIADGSQNKSHEPHAHRINSQPTVKPDAASDSVPTRAHSAAAAADVPTLPPHGVPATAVTPPLAAASSTKPPVILIREPPTLSASDITRAAAQFSHANEPQNQHQQIHVESTAVVPHLDPADKTLTLNDVKVGPSSASASMPVASKVDADTGAVGVPAERKLAAAAQKNDGVTAAPFSAAFAEIPAIHNLPGDGSAANVDASLAAAAPSAATKSSLSPYIRSSVLFSGVNNADYYYITDSTTSLQSGALTAALDVGPQLPVNSRASMPALSVTTTPTSSTSKPTMTPSSSSASMGSAPTLAPSDLDAIKLADYRLRTLESPQPGGTSDASLTDADSLPPIVAVSHPAGFHANLKRLSQDITLPQMLLSESGRASSAGGQNRVDRRSITTQVASRASVPASPPGDLPAHQQQQSMLVQQNVPAATHATSSNTTPASAAIPAGASISTPPATTSAALPAVNRIYLLKGSASVGAVLGNGLVTTSPNNNVSAVKPKTSVVAATATHATAVPNIAAVTNSATSTQASIVTAANKTPSPKTATPTPANINTSAAVQPSKLPAATSGNAFVAENRRGRFSVAVRKDDVTLLSLSAARASAAGGGKSSNSGAPQQQQQQQQQQARLLRSSVPRMSSGVAASYYQPSGGMPPPPAPPMPRNVAVSNRNSPAESMQPTGNGRNRASSFAQQRSSSSALLQQHQQQHRCSSGYPPQAVGNNNNNNSLYTPFVSPAAAPAMRRAGQQQHYQQQYLYPTTAYDVPPYHQHQPAMNHHHQQHFVTPQAALSSAHGSSSSLVSQSTAANSALSQQQQHKSDRAQAIEMIRMLAADVVDACAGRAEQQQQSQDLRTPTAAVLSHASNNIMSNSLPNPSVLDAMSSSSSSVNNNINNNNYIIMPDEMINGDGAALFRAPTAPPPGNSQRASRASPVPRKYSTPPPSQAGGNNRQNNNNNNNFNDLDSLLVSSATHSISVNNVNTCRRYMEALVNKQAHERDLLYQKQQHQLLHVADSLKSKFSGDPTTLDFISATVSKLLLVTLSAAGAPPPPPSGSSTPSLLPTISQQAAPNFSLPQQPHHYNAHQHQFVRRSSNGNVHNNNNSLMNGYHQHGHHGGGASVQGYYGSNLPASSSTTPRGMPSSASSMALYNDGAGMNGYGSNNNNTSASPYYMPYNNNNNNNNNNTNQPHEPSYAGTNNNNSGNISAAYYNTIGSPYQPISYDGGNSFLHNNQHHHYYQHSNQHHAPPSSFHQHQQYPHQPSHHQQLPVNLPNQFIGDSSNNIYSGYNNSSSSSSNRGARLSSFNNAQQQLLLPVQQQQQDEELLLLCGSNSSSIGEDVESLTAAVAAAAMMPSSLRHINSTSALLEEDDVDGAVDRRTSHVLMRAASLPEGSQVDDGLNGEPTLTELTNEMSEVAALTAGTKNLHHRPGTASSMVDGNKLRNP